MADTTVQTTPAKSEIDEANIQEYIRVSGLETELTENEKRQFVQFCTAYQLDPFKGEVHCSVYGQGEYRNMSLIVGFLTYVKRAELSGRLDGWSADIEGTGEDTEAVVTIWRKDWSHEFRHRVHWKEAVQRKRDGSLTAFWKKMPRYLLKKTAIAQAFRLAFPAELAGMGYDEAELPEEFTSNGGKHPDNKVNLGRNTEHSTPDEKQILTFPEKTSSASTAGTSSNNDLKEQIEDLLSQNEKVFPSAHIKWLKQELAKNPPKKRLEEILTHMLSIIADKPAPQERTPADQETPEELIF